MAIQLVLLTTRVVTLMALVGSILIAALVPAVVERPGSRVHGGANEALL